MSEQKFVCIHGHFYQPPRENPWLGEIEEEESAHPFHDWNTRIYHECYLPNVRSRILDTAGEITDVVDNFEKISFNFGPTLLSWVERFYPETHRQIIEADEKSAEQNDGHGNAIAQAYNHMILPLANDRDKETQIVWGIEDFKYRFKRMPEGLWLAETACNEQTLEELIRQEVKFTILEPHQAEAVREFDGQWRDVSDGSLDPKKPYRYFSKINPTLYIDIFFYDGPISKAVAFEKLLDDATIFEEKLKGAFSPNRDPQLVHIATDGESYGHHKAYGDRALAYLLHRIFPEKGIQITNYGSFLEKFPPKEEIKIKQGRNGEGTSWSCSHGVDRWKDDCGCQTGGPLHWNQEWRRPLRDSLDWLRDHLEEDYEREASEFFRDPWEARNDYIHVILNRSEKTIEEFFERNQKRKLKDSERINSLKLLEIQRNAMLMYTSCGWFFNELSGIETVQILKYAAMCIQLSKEVYRRDYEYSFLNHLEKAPSNIPEMGNGRRIYEKYVKPSVATLDHVLSYYGILSTISDDLPAEGKLRLYQYDLDVTWRRSEDFGNIGVSLARVQVKSRVTLEEKDLCFFVIQIGLYDFQCYIREFYDEKSFKSFEREIFEDARNEHLVDLLKKIEASLGGTCLALKDLIRGHKQKVIEYLTRGQVDKVEDFYEKIYDENERMNVFYRSIGLPIPKVFRDVAKIVFSKRFLNELIEGEKEDFSQSSLEKIERYYGRIKDMDISVDQDRIKTFLSGCLNKHSIHFLEGRDKESLNVCLHICELARNLELKLDVYDIQNLIFKYYCQNKADESLNDVSSDLVLKFMRYLEFSEENIKKYISV